MQISFFSTIEYWLIAAIWVVLPRTLRCTPSRNDPLIATAYSQDCRRHKSMNEVLRQFCLE